MTEEKLARWWGKPGKRPVKRLLAAIILGALLVLVIFRQPVAEGVGHLVCAQQKLNCVLKVSRLDFGGLTFRELKVRGPTARDDALSVNQLAIDLDWNSPFSARASWIRGDELTLRVDLSGARPLLGDLDATVNRFSGKGGSSAPMPRINLKNIRIIGDTPLGPIEARGDVIANSADDFSIDMTAPAAKLSFPGANVELNTAKLHAVAVKGDIDATVALDLKSFEAGGSRLSDVKLNLTLDQAAGVLKGAGAASAREISLKDNRVTGAEARADLESPAVNLEGFSLESWLPGVRRLDLTASTGAGSMAGVAWSKGEAKAKLDPREGGGSAGKATFFAEAIKLSQGSAERFEIDLDLSAGTGATALQTLNARGVARLRGAQLTKETRAELAKLVGEPLKASLPGFAAAAGGAVDRAGQKFEAALPIDFALNRDGYSLSALTGTEIRSSSGMALVATGGTERAVTWSSGKTTDWTAGGSLQLSGGGGPTVTLNIASASGDGVKLTATGSVELVGWRVGDDALAATAAGLKLETGKEGGSAAGEMTAQLSGAFAGGIWSRARASGAVASVWSNDTFMAEAPQGLTVAWDEARYGEMKIGAAALRYRPTGRLVESIGDAILGSGVLAGFEIPVTGPNFTAGVKAGATQVTWATQGQLKVSFDTDPAEVVMKLQDRQIPIRLADITGLFEVDEAWRVSGKFGGGTVKAAEAEIADLKGAFDLSGAHSSLNGRLADVSLRFFDPLPPAEKRFEPATFEGGANLKDGVADFSGLFAMAASGVQVANVSGKHSLKTGSGALTFAPTPLIFRPNSFEPKNLSPMLVGPANVTGRVDVSGGAAWSPDGFKATAELGLNRVGFALAGAGVFEGVSGKVVVDDLFAMKSAPGQTLTIDKVTLGLPVEKGAIKFQLIGFDAIRLESAEWPFVGGFIRIKPVDFKFGAEENRIIAQAVDWDLASLVQQFKIDDLKVNGIVSGDFPVVFSTGSARVDKASLSASSKGGVIQYLGSTGDAAASADDNAKMLFDALKDFRYQVMKLGLDGDLSDRMVLTVNLLGRNPAVLDGKAFDLNISVDSPLVDLVTSFNKQIGDYVGMGVKPNVELNSKALPETAPKAAPNETRN